ncbi:MAG: T9SS type A sorting domain-containing protein [Bacteroidota bacterium]
MKLFLISAWLLIVSITGIYAQNVNGVILSDIDNLKVVQVWGNHYERGYAQGYLLANEILDLYTNYLLPQIGSYMPIAKSIIADGVHIQIDNIYVSEAQGVIDGMADAGIDTTGVNYLDILVANSFLDLEGFPGLKDIDMSNGCSSLMSWGDATINTPLNGKSVISRHLDWGVYPAIINNQVMVAHIPSEIDEQPWVMIGFAGQISALSGVSNSGLGAFQHMLSDFTGQNAQMNQAYEPVWFTIRKSLEISDYNNDGFHDCTDIRDAVSSNNQGYADGYIITGVAASVAVEDSLIAIVAEIAPLAPLMEFRDNSYKDSIPGDNLYAANYAIKRNNLQHYCSRYLGAVYGVDTGINISVQKNWSVMRDYSNSGSGNIQFMQFVPEERYVDITVYRSGSPAYQQDSTRYYLDDLFDVQVSVKNIKKKNGEIKIAPNPFNKTANISFESFEGEECMLILSDLQGRIVKIKGNIKINQVCLDASDYTRGVYSVKVLGNKGTKLETKIVIN